MSKRPKKPKPLAVTSALQRFDAKWVKCPESGCWLWTGRIDRNGYGVFQHTTAHRVGYLLRVGRIPKGYTVDHLCRTRHCVNPAHVEAVPHKVNVMRAFAARFTGFCRRGHPRLQYQTCLACDLARQKAKQVRTTNRRTRGWLTPPEKAVIRALVEEGLTHRVIAARLSIAPATVSRVRNARA